MYLSNEFSIGQLYDHIRNKQDLHRNYRLAQGLGFFGNDYSLTRFLVLAICLLRFFYESFVLGQNPFQCLSRRDFALSRRIPRRPSSSTTGRTLCSTRSSSRPSAPSRRLSPVCQCVLVNPESPIPIKEYIGLHIMI